MIGLHIIFFYSTKFEVNLKKKLVRKTDRLISILQPPLQKIPNQNKTYLNGIP